MGKVHVVKPGDHLPKLGADEGFANIGVIWDHPRNAELKAVRKDVCILNPGDEIFVPDKKPKTVTVATGKAHKLIVSQPKLRLVIAVKDAVRQANAVRYGLMATVWTGDPARGHRIARRIKAGTVGINMPYTAFPGIPFGGYKHSGFGRELGLDTLENYLETKSVIVSTSPKPINPFQL